MNARLPDAWNVSLRPITTLLSSSSFPSFSFSDTNRFVALPLCWNFVRGKQRVLKRQSDLYIYIYISSLVCGKEFSSQRNDLTMRLVKIISGATVSWIVVEGGVELEIFVFWLLHWYSYLGCFSRRRRRKSK